MSNTLIQIKRSLTNSQPPSLNVAELGYSYQSNTIFIGTPDGTGTIAIGGKAYLDIQNNIYSLVNAAYGTANSGSSASTIRAFTGCTCPPARSGKWRSSSVRCAPSACTTRRASK